MDSQVCVSVICIAYNHERYIRTCLESLINQNVKFKYEILVHDDASTDNTATIIREYEVRYPEKIRAIYQKENQYSKGVKITASILLPKAQGKYIAVCEGDDFWTDSNKLQVQYEFMEHHPEYSICGHAAYLAEENGDISSQKLFRPYEYDCEVPMEAVLTEWKMATSSLFYKKDARGFEEVPFRGDCPNGDYATMVFLALQGKVYYFDLTMSAYRVVSRGSLNWIWRNNPDKYFESRMKYVAMLERIDEYTEQKYHDILLAYKEDVLFNLYVGLGNLAECKKYKEKYKALSWKQKLKIYIRKYAPAIVKIVRVMREHA